MTSYWSALPVEAPTADLCWFPEHHYRNNLPFIYIISEVIISLTCRIIFIVILIFNQWEAQNSTWNVSQNIIQYHTQVYREPKVFLIPCKQLHLSSSCLLGPNPTNRAKTTQRVMTLWTTQDKDVLIQVCSVPARVYLSHSRMKYSYYFIFFWLGLHDEVKKWRKGDALKTLIWFKCLPVKIKAASEIWASKTFSGTVRIIDT